MNPRTQSLLDWAESRLNRKLEYDLISGDASFRKYYRLRDCTNTWVLMDAPPEKESVTLFCSVAEVLTKAKVNVPKIHASNADLGGILMSDYGDDTYLKALAAGGDTDTLYTDAIKSLVAIQSISEEDSSILPPYSSELLMEEMRLYPDWYVKHHLGHELTAGQSHVLEDAFLRILEKVIRQKRTVVHRDYHSRNLMVTEPNPGILDFQDAVIGPVTYDLLSLLKDAYAEWPQNRIDDWIGQYWNLCADRRLTAGTSREAFSMDLEWTGVQRFLKVAGIFSRLFHRDGKHGYLNDLPRIEGYLADTTSRIPELADLHQLAVEFREMRNSR